MSASNIVNQFGQFYTSTFRMDASRNAGRIGFHIEFEGKHKEHLARYPVWTTTFNIDYHEISKNAVDSYYYDSGKIAVGYAELELHNRPNPFLNYYLRSAIKTGIISQFLRLNLQTNIYYKFSKKFKTKLRIWIGGFLDSSDLPQQYYTYLSSNIDPDFRNNFIFNRTSDLNDFAIGIRQYDIGGPSMHGLILENGKMKYVNDWVLSVNFDITIPKVPSKPFIDLAFVEGKDPYIDFGLKQSFGPVLIIIPLYQSWEREDQIIKDTDWLLKRMRISLNVPKFNYRNFF